MILYIIGPSGAGKTTLAKRFKGAINLDGDDVRKIWPDLKYNPEDRCENNLRVARLAKLLSEQGQAVIVSTICPYRELRSEIQKICNPLFIRVDHKGAKSRNDDAEFEEILSPLLFNISI